MSVYASHWRAKAAPIIAKVIADNPSIGDKELRAKISAEYPFGERKYHPYKIWCDEVARQLGKDRRYFGKSLKPRKQYTGPLVFGQRPHGF